MLPENEFYAFLIKIGLPASIAISIGLAVKSKTQKITIKRAFISILAGVGCAYFTYPFVKNGELGNYEGAFIGMVAILGEKIIDFIMYKFDVDSFLVCFFDAVKESIVKILTGKK
ncbi:MAG: hypothetical protein LH615_04145 [Ferruginibacter sp.]|nr:hypothetical protein [Ferruginibacter sp.]